MPPDGRAAILLAKANEDAIALRVLAAEAAVADAIIGFHAQQAVEKALKAVLVARVGDAPRTHDIVTLLDLARASGVDVPDWLASTEPLVRYAVV